jgi:hypothetical protein
MFVSGAAGDRRPTSDIRRARLEPARGCVPLVKRPACVTITLGADPIRPASTLRSAPPFGWPFGRRRPDAATLDAGHRLQPPRRVRAERTHARTWQPRSIISFSALISIHSFISGRRRNGEPARVAVAARPCRRSSVCLLARASQRCRATRTTGAPARSSCGAAGGRACRRPAASGG